MVLQAVPLDAVPAPWTAEIFRVQCEHLKVLSSAIPFAFEDAYGALDPRMWLGTKPGGTVAPPRDEQPG